MVMVMAMAVIKMKVMQRDMKKMFQSWCREEVHK